MCELTNTLLFVTQNNKKLRYVLKMKTTENILKNLLYRYIINLVFGVGCNSLPVVKVHERKAEKV